VLLILLDNAFRHTPVDGSVTLSAARIDRQVNFVVRDTGEGIPSDSISKVFDRFYQVDSARSGEDHGSGLGLSIAKSITEALGGRVALSSELNQGTEVTISLPLKPKKH
jgi:signal transduction histidine kinase